MKPKNNPHCRRFRALRMCIFQSCVDGLSWLGSNCLESYQKSGTAQ